MISEFRHWRGGVVAALLGLWLWSFNAGQVRAQSSPSDLQDQNVDESAGQESVGGNKSRPEKLPAAFKDVGIDEKLGQLVPGHLVFQDESGQDVTIDSYLGKGRPVLLNFAYHNCPMLCSVMLESFAVTLQEMELAAGTDFEIITVSFSATETADLAARQKTKYVERVGREGIEEGWHFLTGGEESIQLLAESTGFRFKWMESTKEFAHPAALIFLSNDGVITRYLHGMAFPAADVRRAVVEASRGEIGSALDRIIMYCYRYDANANSYVIHAQSLMRIAGFLTLVLLFLGLGIFWRRERKRHEPGALAAPVANTIARV